MREPRLAKFEEDLRRVPGVKGARVVGEEAPTEIHIVSNSDRSPKQVVRDVQSLAAAGFGFPIDHRIVSIVQLEEGSEYVEAPTGNGAATEVSFRPVLERVVLATKGDKGWVKVGLKWPDDQVTEGTAAAGASRDMRARAAADAVARALEPVLEPMKAHMNIDQVAITKIGVSDSVTVSVMFYEGAGSATPLVGSAIIQDDVASAAVRATLQAVNRRIR